MGYISNDFRVRKFQYRVWTESSMHPRRLRLGRCLSSFLSSFCPERKWGAGRAGSWILQVNQYLKMPDFDDSYYLVLRRNTF